MRYRWVIFDLDGTLTDSGEGIKNSTVYALERLGLPVPADSELRKMVGPPLSVGFYKLGVPANRIDEAVRLYREQYSARGKYQNRVYPGIEDCLKRLRGAGLRLCVGTSKPEPLAREILSEFSLAPYFAYIAGATFDASRQNKDDVLCYLLSATGAEDAVMVGDTHYDVIGAHRRGIPCIGVTWGYGLLSELEAAGADALAASPEALSDFLLS
ncbi:MAG: HAD hydrolase-like protein [Clostridia bacterium]|nr:HAD hydrolase-like protein [Clostridia bacterium]